ncbi:WhiB family transcriptional regulator [Streptacidiphilus sp. P02-A3a]|nr:WhiB family transcriptional regulator [Streptacidiphilus sp. P02-A3a]
MASAVFFPPSGERGHARRLREQRALRVCRSCPVREQCASFAQSTQQPFGIWGGLTERQLVTHATTPDAPDAS